MSNTISATELASHLEAILERVHDRKEPVTVERDGKPLVLISPALKSIGRPASEVRAAIGHLRFPDSDFADDLDDIHRSQPLMPDDPWDN